MITITTITIYLLTVLLTRWVMINSMRKKRWYYPPMLWIIPLANIIFTIKVIFDNSDIQQSKIYKWWTGEDI
jgi:hypothetical protein